MVTESSIVINTGRYTMIHMVFFYIPLKFAFNLPHYVTSYMDHTGKKENKKEKEKNNNVPKNLLQMYSNPDPPNTLGLKMNASIHWTTSVRGIYSFSMVIDSFQG